MKKKYCYLFIIILLAFTQMSFGQVTSMNEIKKLVRQHIAKDSSFVSPRLEMFSFEYEHQDKKQLIIENVLFTDSIIFDHIPTHTVYVYVFQSMADSMNTLRWYEVEQEKWGELRLMHDFQLARQNTGLTLHSFKIDKDSYVFPNHNKLKIEIIKRKGMKVFIACCISKNEE